MSPITANLPLRKAAGVSPSRHRAGRDPDLFRNRIVTVTATPQIDHRLKPLKPGLAAALAARFNQGRPKGARLVGAPDDATLGSSLDLQSLYVALERFGEVAHQVVPVRDLLRGGGALPRAVRIETPAIPTDDLDVALPAQPRGEPASRSVRQQIDHPPLFQSINNVP